MGIAAVVEILHGDCSCSKDSQYGIAAVIGILHEGVQL